MDLSWSTERQLYGASALQIFLLPESCHPWAPASGREESATISSPMTGYRCTPFPNLSAASVGNADGMPPIERQLYGASTVKIILLPRN